MDIFESTPREKFYDILFHANRNLVADEIDALLEKLAAFSLFAENSGFSLDSLSAYIFEHQDEINERTNDLYMGSTANILSNNE